MRRLTGCILALAVSSCAQPLVEAECDVLLDHYTERLLLEERPRISPPEIKKKQDEARRLAKSSPRFEYQRCSEVVTREEFECAMNASSVDLIERCLL